MRNSDDVIRDVLNELGELLSQDQTVDNLRQQVNNKYGSEPAIHQTHTLDGSHFVKRPTVPNKMEIGEFTSRYECFKKIIEKVNYGVGNSSAYVEGHAEALKKYFSQAQSNAQDLSVVEGRVSDEITKYNHLDKTNVYVKGYADGLLYVYRALRKSKDLMVNIIYDLLKKGIPL